MSPISHTRFTMADIIRTDPRPVRTVRSGGVAGEAADGDADPDRFAQVMDRFSRDPVPRAPRPRHTPVERDDRHRGDRLDLHDDDRSTAHNDLDDDLQSIDDDGAQADAGPSTDRTDRTGDRADERDRTDESTSVDDAEQRSGHASDRETDGTTHDDASDSSTNIDTDVETRDGPARHPKPAEGRGDGAPLLGDATAANTHSSSAASGVAAGHAATPAAAGLEGSPTASTGSNTSTSAPPATPLVAGQASSVGADAAVDAAPQSAGASAPTPGAPSAHAGASEGRPASGTPTPPVGPAVSDTTNGTTAADADVTEAGVDDTRTRVQLDAVRRAALEAAARAGSGATRTVVGEHGASGQGANGPTAPPDPTPPPTADGAVPNPGHGATRTVGAPQPGAIEATMAGTAAATDPGQEGDAESAVDRRGGGSASGSAAHPTTAAAAGRAGPANPTTASAANTQGTDTAATAAGGAAAADPAAAKATDLLARAELNRLTANGTRVDADVSTDGLGVVRVAATSTGDGLELNLHSDQAAARSLLMGHAEELRQQLRRDGIDVSAITVDNGGAGDADAQPGGSAASGDRTGADQSADGHPDDPHGLTDRRSATDPTSTERPGHQIDDAVDELGTVVDEHIDLVM